MRAFVTGGTGFIGTALISALTARGDHVVAVTRSQQRGQRKLGHLPNVTLVEGDPVYSGPWQEALEGCDVVFNLVGESIGAQRWDARFRQRLRDTRIDAIRFIVEAMAELEPDRRPAVLVSASGIDYYPFALDLGAHTSIGEDDPIDESAPPGDSFMARLCREWEDEALSARDVGARVVVMRTGLVLGRGGVLETMSLPFKLFVGGRIGTGRQWFSWVHVRDATAAYLFAADTDLIAGPVNVVAPGSVRFREFARALGRALGRPSWIRTPAWLVRLVAGEVAEYIIHGRRAVPAALERLGFQFEFPELEAALADIYRR